MAYINSNQILNTMVLISGYEDGYKQGKNDFVNALSNNGKVFYRFFYGKNNLTSFPMVDTSNGLDFTDMFGDCTQLTSVPEIDTSNGKNFCNMFRKCTALKTIPTLNTANGSNLSAMFSGCTSLTSVPKLNMKNCENMAYLFFECKSLKDVEIEFEILKHYNITHAFYRCENLENITFKKIHLGGLDLSYSPKLTIDSLASLINALANVTEWNGTYSVNLGEINLAKLTNEQKAVATAKGWTLL